MVLPQRNSFNSSFLQFLNQKGWEKTAPVEEPKFFLEQQQKTKLIKEQGIATPTCSTSISIAICASGVVAVIAVGNDADIEFTAVTGGEAIRTISAELVFVVAELVTLLTGTKTINVLKIGCDGSIILNKKSGVSANRVIFIIIKLTKYCTTGCRTSF